MSLQATTSQTIGPYFEIGLHWLVQDNLAQEGVSGERVRIEGRVLDGDGVPVAGCFSGGLASQCARQIRASGGQSTEAH